MVPKNRRRQVCRFAAARKNWLRYLQLARHRVVHFGICHNLGFR
ncbi:Uncharacterised protein [Vibrio cholerae]|nr:Uncharacterised protein [Vibrio cholerae]